MKRESNVVVKVLDLSKLEQEAFDYLKRKNIEESYTRCESRFNWGIVETSNGLYALCDEGVGPGKPITEEHPLFLEFHGKSDQSFSLFPIVGSSVNDKELKELPVKEEKNLANFIRTFGSRLETNFNEWNSTLENAGVL